MENEHEFSCTHHPLTVFNTGLVLLHACFYLHPIPTSGIILKQFQSIQLHKEILSIFKRKDSNKADMPTLPLSFTS